MKIAFAVATHVSEQDWPDTLLANSLSSSAWSDWEKHVWITFNNELGLGTIYNRAIDGTSADVLILCHSDVFIKHPELLLSQLTEAHDKYDIVGLAGLCEVKSITPAAWHVMGTKLSGAVSHTRDGKTWLNEYGPAPASVDLLDGLFLSLKMSAVREKGLRFDEQFKFDHYDLDFCLEAKKLGLSIGTWPIKVIHAGMGDRVLGNDSWKESKELFVQKWKPRSRQIRDKMNITYFQRDAGGCQFYRAMLPLDVLYEQKLASVMRVCSDDENDRFATALMEADVVLFPRVTASEKWMRLVAQLKEDGKLVVADYDDWLWSVNPLSPHYRDYGVEEYQYILRDPDGSEKLIDVWKDGRDGFSIETNRERLSRVRKSLEAVDLITTTTELLAEKLRQFNPNVAVLPNCIDFTRWVPAPLKPHDDVRIFWSGGHSHFQDMQIITPALEAIMARFPRATLHLMGYKFDFILKNLPADRIVFHPWEDNLSFPLRCSLIGADISLVPLVDNEFNRCKSPIKWIEQSALGIPSVMSGISPYKEMYNGRNAVMVADNSVAGWIEAISTLVRDPILRARIGGEARRYVEDRYDIGRRAKDWLAVYEANKKEPVVREEKEMEIEVTPCP